MRRRDFILTTTGAVVAATLPLAGAAGCTGVAGGRCCKILELHCELVAGEQMFDAGQIYAAILLSPIVIPWFENPASPILLPNKRFDHGFLHDW